MFLFSLALTCVYLCLCELSSVSSFSTQINSAKVISVTIMEKQTTVSPGTETVCSLAPFYNGEHAVLLKGKESRLQLFH